MRRKQKRLLQIALLLLLVFLLLPNVGLWSASLERMFDSSADGAGHAHVQRMNRHKVQNEGVRRKDWHDYALIKSEAARSGVGEQGRPYPLTDSDRVDQAYRENGFNIFVSNRIALNRSLPDIRHPK
ncbi:polypeptide N-acetylgalactosaminyltransferase 10 [Garra rufa]|uniref:polypeptide N-acetylgalactosaminyltransferase 10 n=1 Tax=Garra rufa TaxID=137080 RepID=UPI003CCED3D5